MKRLIAVAPWFFIIIWSSGFVVARYAFKDADALYFLAIRLLLATAILFSLTVVLKQPIRLSRRDLLSSLAIGIALHGLYLAGVWYAIELGAPSGLSSVITSMQPIVVSLLAVRLLSEPLTRRQLVGLLCGLSGVVLVVLPKLSKSGGFTPETLAFLFIALAGSTIATLLQKKIGHSIPLLIGTTYQFAIAGFGLLAISLIRGKTRFVITHTSIWAMAWAVLVTSIAAVLLLLWLLNRGSAAKVSSLLYLVPPMAVLQAFILFHEKVSTEELLGIALTAAGVALVIRG
ncbi:MAG: DMT family transporter [Actinomycetota bacterium]|jgi:drug/metabolite transporter (DMT)-like permease